MRFIEKVFAAFYIIGIIMLVAHLRDARVFMFVGILGLVLLYLFFGFALYNGIGFRTLFKMASYEDIPAANIVIAIIAGILHATLLFGYLFFQNHWPGGELLLEAGVLSTIALSAFIYIKDRKTSLTFYKRVSIRPITFVLFAAAQTLLGIIFVSFIH